MKERINRDQAAESPIFAASSTELPPAEAAAEAAPVSEAVVELDPVVEEVIPVVEVAADAVPSAEAEVIAAEQVFGPRPDAIGLLARPSKVRIVGPPIAALKSRDRLPAGPPTEAEAAREASSTPRPYSGYLPPVETGSSGAQEPEAESIGRPSHSYLPPASDTTGPSGAPQFGGEPEFSFTFESPDGTIPPEFLKYFTPDGEGESPTGPTTRSTTSTWHTFHTYEFAHTAPGTGPSEPGTGASPAGFGGAGRKITLELPGDFPDIGAGLLGLAGLGGGSRGSGKGSSNLDQPAPGPDSLIPVEPKLARQIENALNLDALPLDNPDLNVVENEFHGVTPVVSPAKVGAFVPDEVLFRETVEAHRDAGSTNPVTQKIIARETSPSAVSSADAANSVSKGTFGKGLQPSVQGGTTGSSAGTTSSFSNPSSSTSGSHGSSGSSNVFPFRRDGPPESNFQSGSFGNHAPASDSQSFFSQAGFTTTTQRPFTHTNAPSHGTFSHSGPSTNFHNSFSQTPSTHTQGSFSHTTPSPHSQSTFNHQTSSHQNTPHTNSFTTFSQTSPATSSSGSFGHRPTHTFHSTFTQSTTHHQPFAQSTFSQTPSHTAFTTARPATHFQSHQAPFTHNTNFAHAVPATNAQNFAQTIPSTSFQAFVPTQAPSTSQGTFSRPQATFIQINPPTTFRHTGSSATARPKAGSSAQVSSSATRLANFNDPNFDSYAFYSDLRNLYGTPK